MSEQYVRVPRELLERVETWVQADCQALTELQALLAAPAEDVRAAVDEPVGYVMPAQIEAMKSVGWMHASRDKGRTGLEVALYRHPLPGADFCKVCIDRHVAELNK